MHNVDVDVHDVVHQSVIYIAVSLPQRDGVLLEDLQAHHKCLRTWHISAADTYIIYHLI